MLERFNGFSGPVYDALSHGLTFGENFAGAVVSVTLTPPPEWVGIVLLNSFAVIPAPQFGTPAVRCDEMGAVEARGVITRNVAPAVQSNIFEIPRDFKPSSVGDKRVVIEAGGAAAGVEVVPSGFVQYLWGPVGLLDLSGLRWRAAGGPVNWATPVDVSLDQPGRRFPRKPGYVLPLGVDRVDGTPTLESVGSIAWEPLLLDGRTGKLGLRIRRVSGLTPGVQYRMTLLVLPE